MMHFSGYEVEKNDYRIPQRCKTQMKISVHGNQAAQEPAGVTCRFWKRDRKWTQKLAQLSRGA